MLGGRLHGPGLSASLLPLLLFFLAWVISTEASPSASSGRGPTEGKHCHAGAFLVPPANSPGHHSHDGFHSGRVEVADWQAFSEKYKDHLADPDVDHSKRTDDNGPYWLITFPSDWKPKGVRDWHNHGDDDISWWAPDGNDCHFRPEFPEASYSYSIAENVAEGTPVGDPVQAFDQDGDQPRHTLEGRDRRYFSIVAEIGQLEIKVPLDYESKETYSVRVRATDTSGRYSVATVTVTALNVEEPGVVSVSGDPRAGAPLTAALRDPDGGVVGLTWTWERATNTTGSWLTITGAVAATYTTSSSDAGKHVRAVARYRDGYKPDNVAVSKALTVAAGPTPTPTPTNTPTPTPTQRPRPTNTPTPTPTPTVIPLAAARATARPITMPTSTPTPTLTVII